MYLGKCITFKSWDGMLASRVPIKSVIERKVPVDYQKIYHTTIKDDLVPGRYVVYHRGLLNEPELDEKIARYKNLIFAHFPNMLLCHPRTLLEINAFRNKPLLAAETLGYGQMIRYMLSPDEQSVDLHFQSLCVLNHSLFVDKRKRTRSFNFILHFPSKFFANNKHNEMYRIMMGILWHATKDVKDGYFDYYIRTYGKRASEYLSKYQSEYDDKFIKFVGEAAKAFKCC